MDFLNDKDINELKSNTQKAALYIAVFEALKAFIIDNVATYVIGSINFDRTNNEKEFEEKVLDNYPYNVDYASLIWLEKQNAIKHSDFLMYQELRKLKEDLTKKIMFGLKDGLPSNINSYFEKLFEIRIKIEKWWVLEINIDSNVEFEGEKITGEDIVANSENVRPFLINLLTDNFNDYKDVKQKIESQLNDILDIDAEKKYFQISQFWALTIQASFAHSSIYVDKEEDEKEAFYELKKKQFRKEMHHYITNDLIDKFKENSDNLEVHGEVIEALSNWTYKEYSHILNNQQLNIGICQKIINLYLKYLWCANYINFEPPHFPIDRKIQVEARIPESEIVSWTTEIESYEDDYLPLINRICNSKKDHLAKWELIKYNRIINND